jgi:hypothetical protein
VGPRAFLDAVVKRKILVLIVPVYILHYTCLHGAYLYLEYGDILPKAEINFFLVPSHTHLLQYILVFVPFYQINPPFLLG